MLHQKRSDVRNKRRACTGSSIQGTRGRQNTVTSRSFQFFLPFFLSCHVTKMYTRTPSGHPHRYPIDSVSPEIIISPDRKSAPRFRFANHQRSNLVNFLSLRFSPVKLINAIKKLYTFELRTKILCNFYECNPLENFSYILLEEQAAKSHQRLRSQSAC